MAAIAVDASLVADSSQTGDGTVTYDVSASIVADSNMPGVVVGFFDVPPLGASVDAIITTAQDGFTSLSGAGYHMDVGISPPTTDGLNMFTGRGTYGPVVVTEALPGAIILAQGRGRRPLSAPVVGAQGAMSVSLRVGAAGSIRAVVYLTDGTNLLGINVDASNRPYAILQDSTGTVVGESAGLGPALVDGKVVNITLSWDSNALVDGAGGFFAAVKVDGVVFDSGAWATVPSATWISWVPTDLLLGFDGVVAEFNGTVQKVQLGNVPGI